MRHPTDGTLRRLLDEPAGVADTDRAHVAGCRVCLTGLAAVEADASFASGALDFVVPTDVDAGWLRLLAAGEPTLTSSEADAGLRRLVAGGESSPASASEADAGLQRLVASGEPSPASASEADAGLRRLVAAGGRGRAGRWRGLLSRPVVAVAGVAVLLTGASAAAAGDWLQIFRTEQIAPVTAPEADLITMPELDAFGELVPVEPIDIHAVADAAAASQATGLAVPVVRELPKGVNGPPTYQVGARASALFTFSAAKTAQTAAAAGVTLPPPPPGLDGSKFRLVAGPGLVAMWSQGRPVPAMIVARAVAPTAYTSSGVPFETARDYLLPVLPSNVAAQLRGFSGDGTTLPLFTSLEHMKSSATDVGGVPATLLSSRDSTMSAVVWLDNGIVTAVAGSLSADEVLAVARGLGSR
ncbi:hypothetical protein DFJ67_7406 [Asanoa ferruginea]|uniref:DUF4367 domain-containing protein n=1 Tax=Asanoa ferruginea TaxID=53367 RepID=A0A3D9ZYS8_9ACTN|nr:hypothetical protein [Asanoa ferruginea]REG01324.1 hypothetical protein DFJ67_7406 [Asanoa ferruginea]GIF52186.1 hypothetical protein Afe04nite_67250 [Asanoa ferruginea]